MATSPKAAPKSADTEGAAEAPKKSKKLVIILALAGVLLAGGGGGAWYFMHNKAAEEHKEAKPAPVKPPVFMPLEVFVVNLQSENGDQFLQVNMTLQVPEQSEMDSLKTYMPLIRSRILSLLSSKKPSEILSPDGKAKLAADLSESIKQPFAKGVPPAKVDGVFFTSFVVQ